MRFGTAILLFCSVCAARAADDPAVIRARGEVSKMEDLAKSGVVSQARVGQAREALADAEDQAAIRVSLYATDIPVEKADELVEITARRLERKRKALDERNGLLEHGIIAKSEIAEAATAVEQAEREHEWAATRAKLAREVLEAVKAEQEAMRQLEQMAAGARTATSANIEHFGGTGHFDLTEFPKIERDFEHRFLHPLPVSAMGETAVHKSLGFDHRNRVDIALQPDMPEGAWLRRYLTARGIPYFAFRSAVAHKATGAHIHIGPASTHYFAQTGKPGRGSAGE